MRKKPSIRHKLNSFKFRAADFLKIEFAFIAALALTFAVSQGIAFAQETASDPSIDAKKSSREEPTAQPYGLDLNGVWTSPDAPTVEVQHKGNSIVGIVKEATPSLSIGDISFSGTLSGDQFTGEIFMGAKNCPNLNHFVSATGIVSSKNRIFIATNEGFRFDTKTCEAVEQITKSATFTRLQEEPQTINPGYASLPPAESTPTGSDAIFVISPSNEGTAEYVKKQTGKTPSDWMKRSPTIDLKKKYEPPMVFYEQAYVEEVMGDIRMMLPRSDRWVPFTQGDTIPYGSRVLTGKDSTALISIPGQGVFRVGPFSDTLIRQEGGYARSLGVQMNEGEIEILRRAIEQERKENALKVHTPEAVAGVRGTHFWVAYDKNTHTSVFRVYEGEIELTANATGEKIVLKQINDVPAIAMVVPSQKIAEAEPLPQAQERGNSFVWILVVIVLGGGAFILYKTGKLQQLLRK